MVRLVLIFSPNFLRVELDQQLPLERPCEHRLRLAWASIDLPSVELITY